MGAGAAPGFTIGRTVAALCPTRLRERTEDAQFQGDSVPKLRSACRRRSVSLAVAVFANTFTGTPRCRTVFTVHAASRHKHNGMDVSEATMAEDCVCAFDYPMGWRRHLLGLGFPRRLAFGLAVRVLPCKLRCERSVHEDLGNWLPGLDDFARGLTRSPQC